MSEGGSVGPSRGLCPVCGRDSLLTKKGLVRTHGKKKTGVWPPQTCEGVGQQPVLDKEQESGGW